MKPFVTYLNSNGEEATNRREIELLSRRNFIKRSSLFLPLAFFAGSLIPRTAKASSVIINRTISAASQNAISMANATWARPVTIPATWTKVRIGCRMHMTNSLATMTSDPIFTMGLCSGTTNQYGDTTTTHFVGQAFDNATWTFSAGPPVVYNPAVQPIGRKRVGTTNTDTINLTPAGSGFLFNADAAANTADRFITFIDLFKGSPNFTIHSPFHCAATTGALADVTSAKFLFYMAQLSPAPSEGNYIATSADQTLAVDEGADGTLNAVNFYWNRADSTIEICDIAVAVLA